MEGDTDSTCNYRHRAKLNKNKNKTVSWADRRSDKDHLLAWTVPQRSGFMLVFSMLLMNPRTSGRFLTFCDQEVVQWRAGMGPMSLKGST